MRQLGLGLLVLLLTLGAYRTLWSAEFVYEDAQMRQAIQSIPAAASWVPAFAPRSILIQSWRLDAVLGHGTPRWFHVEQLGWHLLNILLLGVLVWRLFGHATLAWLTAALFAVHPLGSEAVSYLAARGDVLATTGMLAAAVLLSGRFGWMRLLAAGGCLLGAVGFKETAIVGAVLVTWVAWPRLSEPLRVGAVMGTLAVGVLMVRYALWATVGDPGIAHGGFGYLAYQSAMVLRLTGLAIWPAALNLDVDAVLWSHRLVLGALGSLAAITGGLLWQAPRIVRLGWLWWVGALAPRLFLRQPDYLHEHHAYTALIGLCLIGAWAITHIGGGHERVVA